jgi:uncharacterized protein (DUF1786 family)
MADTDKHTYRFVGAKGPGEVINRIIFEGTTADPKVFVDLGNEIEMTEEQAAKTRKDHGVNLRRLQVSGEEISEEDDKLLNPGPSPEDAAPKTKADQQRAQAATSGASPAPTPDTPKKGV